MTISAALANTVTYSEVRRKVFEPRCLGCHNNQPRVRFTDWEQTVQWLDAIDRAVFKEKSMPQDSRLTDQESSLLRAWIDAGAPDDHGNLAPKPEIYPGPLEQNYASIRWHIFEQKCLSCHRHAPLSDKVPLGNYKKLLDPARGLVIPGNPDQSRLFIATDLPYYDPKLMPPKDSGIPPLTPQESVTLKYWIQNGAPER
jgi:hypothetical protein